MTAAELIPTPDPLQVHWGLFQLFLSLTQVIHFLVMNCLLGFALIAFVNHFRGSDLTGENQFIGSKIPILMAFTVNLGIAPLLFLQVLYGNFLYATQVLMGVWIVSIIFMMLIGYYGSYIYTMRFEKLGSLRAILSGVIALILLGIAFITSAQMSFMIRPEGWLDYFNNSEGTLINGNDPTLVPRYLHFVLASFSVGGLVLALYYDHRKRKGDTGMTLRITRAMNWFVRSTIINLAIGFWFFFSLPLQARPMMNGTLGILFVSCLTPALLLAVIALILGWKKRVRPAAWALLATVTCMSFVREIMRVSALSPWFSVTKLEVVPQYSPFFVFLLVFVVGLWMIWYMIRLVSEDREVKK